jgi:hypothetical protein
MDPYKWSVLYRLLLRDTSRTETDQWPLNASVIWVIHCIWLKLLYRRSWRIYCTYPADMAHFLVFPCPATGRRTVHWRRCYITQKCISFENSHKKCVAPCCWHEYSYCIQLRAAKIALCKVVYIFASLGDGPIRSFQWNRVYKVVSVIYSFVFYRSETMFFLTDDTLAKPVKCLGVAHKPLTRCV